MVINHHRGSSDFGYRLPSIYTNIGDFVCAGASWGTGLGTGEAVTQAGEAVGGPSQTDSEETRTKEELMQPKLDEQTHDETLKIVYDWVCTIDGQLLQPINCSPIPIFP